VFFPKGVFHAGLNQVGQFIRVTHSCHIIVLALIYSVTQVKELKQLETFQPAESLCFFYSHPTFQTLHILDPNHGTVAQV